jgi:phage repressor protein C with HTH and peptisase S24 domain
MIVSIAMLNINLYSIAKMKTWTTQEEADNLKELFKSVENKAEFAREHKFPGGASMISQNISGNRPISMEAAIIYSTALKQPLNKISPRLAEIFEQVTFINAENDKPAKRLPIVGRAQLGDDGFFVELEYPVGFGDGYVEHSTNDKDAYALQCKGDSMKPRIKPNEFVIIEPNTKVSNGDEVLVKCTKGRVMVKELLYTRDGEVHLGSVNESFAKITIPLSEIESIQYVGAIVKSSKWKPNL